MSKPTLKAVIVVLLVIYLVAGGVLLVRANRQNIYDWLALFHYHPTSTIVNIANEDGMTAYTRKVFYVNHPQIDSKAAFAKVCPDNSEQMVVLGCYHVGQQGIFVLSVNNSDLYGIEQVTAAYETLHAIYQRLSPSDQATLNQELIAFENNGLRSSEIKAQIANFRKTEPGGVLNEMTSLFGTEVQNLPPALSKFYSKYFTSRQLLLNYYNGYETAFTSRQQLISGYDAELSSLHATINSDENQLQDEQAALQNEQTALNNERSSNDITEYNAGVPGYNQQVDQYNSEVQTVGSLVDQYNQIVDQRNATVLEEQQLTQSISSSNVKPINNQ